MRHCKIHQVPIKPNIHRADVYRNRFRNGVISAWLFISLAKEMIEVHSVGQMRHISWVHRLHMFFQRLSGIDDNVDPLCQIELRFSERRREFVECRIVVSDPIYRLAMRDLPQPTEWHSTVAVQEVGFRKSCRAHRTTNWRPGQLSPSAGHPTIP